MPPMSLNVLTVSNTSPLTNLAVIGRLDLVRRQFASVMVPAEVWAEMLALPHPQGRRSLAAGTNGWLARGRRTQRSPDRLHAETDGIGCG